MKQRLEKIFLESNSNGTFWNHVDKMRMLRKCEAQRPRRSCGWASKWAQDCLSARKIKYNLPTVVMMDKPIEMVNELTISE